MSWRDFQEIVLDSDKTVIDQYVSEMASGNGTVLRQGHSLRTLAVYKFAGSVPRKAIFGAGFQ
jgi:hypothetical protein